MNHNLISLGILIIFLGIIIVFLGSFLGSEKSNTKVAVGGFWGFIPFGFANDKNMLKIVMALSGLIFLVYITLKLTQ
ncbi:hypothetical protein ISS07_04145 [Candidatus Woesearchaeota archaeon]|nr:hypothetical protein [Candidatus Woesearchaeota archaeon]